MDAPGNRAETGETSALLEEERLQSALLDILDSPAEDVRSFFRVAGLDNLLDGMTQPDQVWPAFRDHYTMAGRIDEARFATDLAIWPPIASRVAELRAGRP